MLVYKGQSRGASDGRVERRGEERRGKSSGRRSARGSSRREPRRAGSDERPEPERIPGLLLPEIAMNPNPIPIPMRGDRSVPEGWRRRLGPGGGCGGSRGPALERVAARSPPALPPPLPQQLPAPATLLGTRDSDREWHRSVGVHLVADPWFPTRFRPSPPPPPPPTLRPLRVLHCTARGGTSSVHFLAQLEHGFGPPPILCYSSLSRS